ncbi:probable basic-leucine zipper transcription factor R [Carassius carassius]|uniref:probable basic-leucine zipper transcription factor R n=1 Tax=Carassius carassius TaxID=217509 RepID=UPI0028691694|nr:probable basic-leucine zipper transcription factor R [Carassius carassius]
MDTAASDTAEPVVRPERQSKPPSHLSDYEVDYIPAVDPPPISSSRCHSQHKSQSRKTSHSKASSHSRSSGHSIISGVQATSALTSSQAAMVDERIKQRQYDNLLQQIEEDTLAEIEYQRLQTQAKEAQRVQEEALMAKEALTNQLERRRKLKKAETDLEVAKLVNSLLSQDLSVDNAGSEGSPDTTVPPPQSLHASPVHSSVSQQSPSPVLSMMQATQTVSEAQSTSRGPCIVQSLKTPPLPLQVPAYTAQLSAWSMSPSQQQQQQQNPIQRTRDQGRMKKCHLPMYKKCSPRNKKTQDTLLSPLT